MVEHYPTPTRRYIVKLERVEEDFGWVFAENEADAHALAASMYASANTHVVSVEIDKSAEGVDWA